MLRRFSLLMLVIVSCVLAETDTLVWPTNGLAVNYPDSLVWRQTRGVSAERSDNLGVNHPNRAEGNLSYIVQYSTSPTFTSFIADTDTDTLQYNLNIYDTTGVLDTIYSTYSNKKDTTVYWQIINYTNYYVKLKLLNFTDSTTYYWKVYGGDFQSGIFEKFDSTATWGFTTKLLPPTVPILSTPTNNAILTATPITFSWTSSSRATSYAVHVYQVHTVPRIFYTTILTDSGLTTTNVVISSLPSYATLYWSVNAKNSAGTSFMSDTLLFQTTSAPTLVSPSNNSVSSPISVTFAWDSVASGNNINRYYIVQLSTSSSFATTVINEGAFVNGAISDTLPIKNLANGTTYYWEVYSNWEGTLSPWSSVWSFTTIVAAPTAPTLISPSNGATNQPISLNVSWSTVSSALSYGVSVSTTSSFVTTVTKQTGLTGTSISLNNLSNNRQYFWEVNATNAGGTSSWSTIWSFTTVAKVSVLSQNNTAISKRLLISNSGIVYELSAASRVLVALYDIQGRQVRQILNSMQNAGSYSIDLRREHITTGFYIVKFKAGSFIAQKRLALMN